MFIKLWKEKYRLGGTCSHDITQIEPEDSKYQTKNKKAKARITTIRNCYKYDVCYLTAIQ